MSKLSELGSVSQKSRNTSKETPEVVSEQSTGDRDAIDTSSGGRPWSQLGMAIGSQKVDVTIFEAQKLSLICVNY